MRQKPLVFCLGLLFVLSIGIQILIYPDWDMLFLLEGGKRLLAGGTYVNDLFESNPPLIYYLSIGINWLASIVSINTIFLFKLIVYVFILYSLTFCHYILKSNTSDFSGKESILLILAFFLLIFPVCYFGEREHIMLILVMPYYFLLYQTTSGFQFKSLLKVIISVFAALGIALKPYFIFSLLLSESLFMYWQRNWKTLFRLEVQIVWWIFILYLISIAVFMPDFYQVISPLIFQFYVSEKKNLLILCANPAVINAFFLLLNSLFLHRFINRIEILFIAILIGYLCSFIFQGKGWAYHAYPLITLNALLATRLIYRVVADIPSKKQCFAYLTGIVMLQFFLTLLPWGIDCYKKINYYKNTSSSFWNFINLDKNNRPNPSLFFFATDMSRIMPIVYYSNAHLGSRYPSFWMLPGILNQEEALKQCTRQCLEAKEQLLHHIIEDFKRYQPDLVYVDINTKKYFINPVFDYLQFMQKKPEFKSIWQNYCYRTTLNHYAIYQRCPQQVN